MDKTNTIEIDDDSTLPWDPTVWIKAGKKYPASNTPSHVLLARSAILEIPTHMLSMLPDKTLSVVDLLKYTLPVKSTTLVSSQVSDAFTPLEPNEDPKILATRPIPPDDYLAKLESVFGQAWFDGAQSITDTRYKDSRLPLWTLTFWKEISMVIRKKMLWKRSEAWIAALEGREGMLGVVDEAREMLSCLEWGIDLRALGASTPAETLTQLLSDQWFNDELINMLMRTLSERARLDPHHSKSVVIAPLAFAASLIRAHTSKDYDKKSERLLWRYKEMFKSGGRQFLYFPVHTGGNHWVAFRSDFKEKSLCYGMPVSNFE
jgi:hypothetical protein